MHAYYFYTSIPYIRNMLCNRFPGWMKGIKKALSFEKANLSSGAEWARTTDSRIFSPMLYQLSYSTKIWVGKTRYFFEKAKLNLKFVPGIF